MSASTTPTRRPCWASDGREVDGHRRLADAALAGGDRVHPGQRAGWANGISRSALPPRSCSCSSARCSSLITPRVDRRPPVTPSTAARAAVVSLVRVSFSGQPETVSRIVDGDLAGVVDRDALDHAELGDGLADLGVDDRREGSVEGVVGHRGSGGGHAIHARSRRMSVGEPGDLRSMSPSSRRRPHLEPALLELVEQAAQLGAHEVAGGDARPGRSAARRPRG